MMNHWPINYFLINWVANYCLLLINWVANYYGIGNKLSSDNLKYR
jgi:hypothetical protein